MARAAGPAFSLIATGLALSGPAVAQAPPGDRPPAAIYARTCGYCHGQNVAPVIRGRHLPPDLIVQLVRTGPRAMPAFRPTEITDRELDALSRWISASAADPKEHGK